MNLINKISLAINERKFVKIYRYYNGTEFTIHGYILDSSEDYILIHQELDFQLDGYIILKISDITYIRYGKNEKYFEMMLKYEGVYKNVGIDYSIDLTNMQTILSTIKSSKNYAILECQNQIYSRFYIGPIVEILDKSVDIKYFDATGKFKKKLVKVKFKKITTIQFDNRYVNVFSKYTRIK